MDAPLPWLWLYRPTAPTPRAQAIQVVHMAHAMAGRGHEVTLAVDPARPGVTAQEILAWYGLRPVPGLRLWVLPAGRTAASLAFRGIVAGWLLRHRLRGVVYARNKRYARMAVRAGARVVWEAHEVDSVQAAERGEDPRPHRVLEGALVRGAAGIVANAPGTLEVLREAWPHLPAAVVIPNGTAVRPIEREGRGVGYLGSLRPWKDLDTLARAARQVPVTLVGADPGSPEVRALVAASGGALTVEAPVSYARVSEVLARFAVLVLPLGRGVLPERLVSPLKLADYLAAGRPIVAADVPAVRAIAGEAFVPYPPGDPESLVRALRAALGAARPDPVLRPWATRAAEVEAFVARAPLRGRIRA